MVGPLIFMLCLIPWAVSPLTAFGALPFLARFILPAALGGLAELWWLVQKVHELLYPVLFGVCAYLRQGALLRAEPGGWGGGLAS